MLKVWSLQLSVISLYEFIYNSIHTISNNQYVTKHLTYTTEDITKFLHSMTISSLTEWLCFTRRTMLHEMTVMAVLLLHSTYCCIIVSFLPPSSISDHPIIICNNSQVKVTCECGHRSVSRACSDNTKEYQRIATSLLASKMADMQLGHSVDIRDLLGNPSARKMSLKT